MKNRLTAFSWALLCSISLLHIGKSTTSLLHADTPNIAGGKLGLQGGILSFLVSEKSTTDGTYIGFLGGDISLCGGYNFSFDAFVLGLEGSLGWIFGKMDYEKTDKGESYRTSGLEFSASTLLGVDMHGGIVPYVRLGYAANTFGEKTGPDYNYKIFPFLRWGMGIEKYCGPLILRVEFSQDLTISDLKDNDGEDMDAKIVVSRGQVGVLYKF